MSGERVHEARLRRLLFEAWGSSDDPVFVAKAPGRVNLIGEHTDYNLGLALPAAIGLELFVAFRPRSDRRVELHSLAFGETRAFGLDDVDQPRAGCRGARNWIDYVAGTAWALARAGIQLRGVQGVIDTRLPVGSGLASSAALELASAWTLIDPERGSVPTPHRLAVLAHQAEEEFVGVRSGMMDQVAASLGRMGHALMLDCRSMEAQPIPLPTDIALVVCDSGVLRRLAESAYNQRRAECEDGVRLLRRHLPRVESLRDVGLDEFERWKGELPETVGRRCEHVILENDRVRAVVGALRSGSTKEIGPLFAESHASLRDLFEVSSPELDTLVEAASGIDGVVGARLTGAGFGGCTVNLVESDSVEAFRRTVTSRYEQRTARTLTTYAVETVDGAGLVPT
jgi:galactokinase